MLSTHHLPEPFVCRNDRTLPDMPLLQPFRQDSFFFFWVKKGDGHCWIDFIRRKWKPGKLYLTMPRNRLLFESRLPVEGTWLAFTEGFLQAQGQPSWQRLPVIQNAEDVHELEPSEEEIGLLDGLLIRMEAEYTADKNKDKEGFQSGLNSFLVCLSRIYIRRANAAPFSPDERMMGGVRELLYERYDPLRGPEGYAQILGMTLPQLNRVIRDQTGRALDALLQERLLLEAKRLLVHSGLSVKEIATTLGFEDAAFARVFKRDAGLTPVAFRAALHRQQA